MLASNESFGVEIECHVLKSVINDNGWRIGPHGHGIQIPNWPAGWKVEYDGSVLSRDHRFEGVEVVSPILIGEDGLRQLVMAVDWLKQAGTRVRSDCGLHVHCGAGEMSENAIDRLIDLMFAYEVAFYALNGGRIKSRMSNRYCTPIHSYFSRHERYQSLNLTNLGRSHKNTVEFRCFFATLDANVVVSTVYMCVSSAARAVNGKDAVRAIDRSTPLKAMRDYIESTFAAGPDVPDMTYCLIEADTQADILRTMLRQARRAERSLCHA
jgi:hypothetical protein